MHALEQLRGLRAVASPGALDAARWSPAVDDEGRPLVLRIAPDEALALGAVGVTVDDAHAIVEPEAGFVGTWLSDDEIAAHVVPHLEWQLPAARPALAQGAIAGVPAKLWLDGDGGLLVVAAAYAHELEARLW